MSVEACSLVAEYGVSEEGAFPTGEIGRTSAGVVLLRWVFPVTCRKVSLRKRPLMFAREDIYLVLYNRSRDLIVVAVDIEAKRLFHS